MHCRSRSLGNPIPHPVTILRTQTLCTIKTFTSVGSLCDGRKTSTNQKPRETASANEIPGGVSEKAGLRDGKRVLDGRRRKGGEVKMARGSRCLRRAVAECIRNLPSTTSRETPGRNGVR